MRKTSTTEGDHSGWKSALVSPLTHRSPAGTAPTVLTDQHSRGYWQNYVYPRLVTALLCFALLPFLPVPFLFLEEQFLKRKENPKQNTKQKTKDQQLTLHEFTQTRLESVFSQAILPAIACFSDGVFYHR
jgi:hypothetical protein